MIRLNLIPSDFDTRTGKALTYGGAYLGEQFWPDTGLTVAVKLTETCILIGRARAGAQTPAGREVL